MNNLSSSFYNDTKSPILEISSYGTHECIYQAFVFLPELIHHYSICALIQCCSPSWDPKITQKLRIQPELYCPMLFKIHVPYSCNVLFWQKPENRAYLSTPPHPTTQTHTNTPLNTHTPPHPYTQGSSVHGQRSHRVTRIKRAGFVVYDHSHVQWFLFS